MGNRAKEPERYGTQTFRGSAAAWVGGAKRLMFDLCDRVMQRAVPPDFLQADEWRDRGERWDRSSPR